MKRYFFITVLALATLSQAEYRVFIDNSMAAPQTSTTQKYEERVSVGPYVEFTNVKMKDTDYRYKVAGRPYKISIDNSFTYGFAGNMPFDQYIGFYMMVAYQYLGIDYQDKDLEGGYALVEKYDREWEDFNDEMDSSDVKGHQDLHTALFQIGFDLGLPLYANYNNQTMFKIFSYIGGIAGKTFFSNDSRFLSPILWGDAYGLGARFAIHSVTLSAGIRNSREFIHTNYEKKMSESEYKNDDEMMLDINNYIQPFVNLTISLF